MGKEKKKCSAECLVNLHPNNIYIHTYINKIFKEVLKTCTKARAMAKRLSAPSISWGTSSSLSRSPFYPAPCVCSRESSSRWTKCLGPCTNAGDLGKAPGSWLWTSSSLATGGRLESDPALEDTWITGGMTAGSQEQGQGYSSFLGLRGQTLCSPSKGSNFTPSTPMVSTQCALRENRNRTP